MRHSFPRAARILLAATLLAPSAVRAQMQEAPRPLTAEDYGKWESLGASTLSPDGRWIVYAVNRVDDEDELRIRKLSEDSTRVVAYGSRPRFSADGRWLAYAVGHSEAERERMQKAKKPVREKLALLDLRTGATTTVEDVAAFDFSPDGRWLAMRRYPAEGRKARGADLIVRELASGTDTNFGNVAEHAWRDGAPTLALLVDAEGQAGNGVQLFDAATGRLRTLDSEKAAYSGLVWREDADDLAVLRTRADSAYADTAHVVVAWTGLAGRAPRERVFDPASAGGFPADTRIVTFRPLAWSDDGATLFFGIREREKKPAKVEKDSAKAEPKADEDEAAGVEVWHARDVDIVPEQKVRAGRDKRENDLAAWHLGPDRFVRLDDDVLESVTLADGHRVAIGMDRTPYDVERMFGPVYSDVYRIDVGTGEREKILERVQYSYGTSPEGRYFLYLKDDRYRSVDLRTGRETDLTGALPTSFVNLENDHTVKQKPPFGTGGWYEDGRAVLLYDRYDAWRVALDGSGAVRLTDGAQDSVRHRRVWLDHEDPFIDAAEPMYLMLYGEWSKKSGYGRLRPGGRVERSVWLDKRVSRLMKADSTDTYAYIVEGFDDSPDLFVGGARLADARQVSRTNPFQSDYAWGRSELIEFRNKSGKRLQGALHYPAGYEPGKKYPMLVYIYEITSNTAHNYSVPSERSAYNPAVFTSRGYFVLRPDIVYRDRDPGLSAVEALVPAVEAVVATGMVDPARVGLVGHSWGGYQTTFAVTQTDVFRAAVAGAPLTNLVSMYNSIYWNTGGTDARIFEISQGRMEVPPWEDMPAYTRNSPLHNIQRMRTPLLMAFGTEDGAVEFNQGVEFYNAARRAGKDMVLLVYEGENHGLAKKPNQIDYHRRILEWFGHYLKGEEPAAWITQGVPYLEQEKVRKKATARP